MINQYNDNLHIYKYQLIGIPVLWINTVPKTPAQGLHIFKYDIIIYIFITYIFSFMG